jgi:dienelactone hydrolase
MRLAVLLAALLIAAPGLAAPGPVALAGAYGGREAAFGVRLSPDGDRVLYMAPDGDTGTAVVVSDIAAGTNKAVLKSDGKFFDVRICEWKSTARIICRVAAIRFTEKAEKNAVRLMRTLAVAADGTGSVELGALAGYCKGVMSTGVVFDLLVDDPDHIIMDTCSLQRVDLATNTQKPFGDSYESNFGGASDGRGNLRYRTYGDADPNGYLRDMIIHQIRPKGTRRWETIGSSKLTGLPQFAFLGFDDSGDNVLATIPVEGRQALFRLPATGATTRELVFAHPQVDVDGVLRIGKYNRPVAAVHTLDSRQYFYFDAVLEKRSKALSKALRGTPPVAILDESWDGRYNLVLVGGEQDGGAYYRYDTQTRQLGELLKVRPGLEARPVAVERRVDYPAGDGASVPAYLTLPPGVAAKGLPAIVMPHGGPAARDALGFDWLAQYYAQLGYVVLKPNYRGSTGYGAGWFQSNAFKGWRTAMADINAGARWLVAQGIADPARLHIIGWSYGGYAALQANVVDPGLYRSVVAVAPVTDLKLLIKDQIYYTSYSLSRAEFAQGQDAIDGSPARNAGRIKAPVLIFQGTKDLNVDQEHAKVMDAALERAVVPHRLVLYPDLDHQLESATARADLLATSAAWLAAAPPR